MLGRFLAGAIAVTIVTGCGAVPVPPSARVICTLIGCDSHVRFGLVVDLKPGETYDIEACVDGNCVAEMVRVRQRGDGTREPFVVDARTDTVVFVLPAGDYSGTHTVSLAVRGADLEPIQIQADTEFERSQPNGADCPPVCWQAIVTARG